MRCIGAAEKALELMIDRGMSRKHLVKKFLNLAAI
jgi:hypothetical protein